MNARNGKGELIYKTWTIWTSCTAMAERLSLKCPGDRVHRHAPLEGKEVTASAYYPIEMARRVCQVFQRRQDPEMVCRFLEEAEKGGPPPETTAEECQGNWQEGDEETILKNLKVIHNNTGTQVQRHWLRH